MAWSSGDRGRSAWNSVSWSSGTWSRGAWSNVSWSSGTWSHRAWSNVSWNRRAWSRGTWGNVARNLGGLHNRAHGGGSGVDTLSGAAGAHGCLDDLNLNSGEAAGGWNRDRISTIQEVSTYCLDG